MDAFSACFAWPKAGVDEAIANAPRSKDAANALDSLLCITFLLAE